MQVLRQHRARSMHNNQDTINIELQRSHGPYMLITPYENRMARNNLSGSYLGRMVDIYEEGNHVTNIDIMLDAPLEFVSLSFLDI
jgi:hypothetical protein